MITNGTVPVGLTAIGGGAAELFIPPAAFGDGVEHRFAGAASRFIKRDATEILSLIGAPVVFSAEIEIPLNNPSASPFIQPNVRMQWEDSGGVAMGTPVALLHNTNAPFQGWQHALPRTRLSVLAWVPPLTGQLTGGTGTVAKMAVYCGNNGTGAGSGVMRVKGIDTWVLSL
jgi:hypothetical protein